MTLLKLLSLSLCLLLISVTPISNSTILQGFEVQNSSISTCKIIQNSGFKDIEDGYQPVEFDATEFLEDWKKSYESSESTLRNWRIGANITAGAAKVVKDGTLDLLDKLSDRVPVKNPSITLIKPFAKSLANRVGESLIDVLRDEFIEGREIEFEQRVRESLDLFLVSQKYSSNSLPENTEQLKKSYGIYLSTQPGKENLGVFNKIMLEKAYGFIDANRSLIETNIEDLSKMKTRLGKLETEYKGLSDQVYQTKKDIKKNSRAIEKVRDELRAEMNQKFAEFEESLANIAENQQKNSEAIDNISANVKKNAQRISSLEKDMSEVKGTLKDFDQKLKEHDRLIGENKYYIEVLSSYSYNSLDLDGKVKAFERKDLPFIKRLAKENPEEYQAKLDTLRNLKDRKDFVQIASAIQQIGNNAYSTLVDNGFLKGKDAERVGKFMQYFNAATNIGIAYANPNPMTVSSAIFSTMSLFGKKKSKKPSPEMVMLRKIYERMEERFNIIDKRLDVIDKKIDALIELNIEIHSSLIESIEINKEINKIRFDNIDKKLDVISGKVDKTIEMIRFSNEALKFLIWEKILVCNGANDAYVSRFGNLSYEMSNYKELRDFYPNCSNCILGLIQAAETAGDFYFKRKLPSNLTDHLSYFKIYEPTFDIYNSFYSPTTRLKLNISASIPVSSIGNNYALFRAFRRDSTLVSNKKAFEKITEKDNLINPYDLFLFTDYYLRFVLQYNDFLNTEVGGTLPMRSLDEYLNLSSISKSNNTQRIVKHLKFLHDLTEKALIQQNILSGHHLVDKIYGILYEGTYQNVLYPMVMSRFLKKRGKVRFCVHHKLKNHFSSWIYIH